jgi:hypothetical protein
MIQPIRKLILLLPLLFAGALAAIHAQPYGDASLRAFLADAACAAPCFIGIQPGVTDLTTLQAILDAHPWIEGYRYARGMALDSGFLSWTWSGAQPAFIDSGIEGKLWVQDARVQWLEVATRFSFGDLWLMQRPDGGHSSPASVEPRRIHHEAGYGQIVARTEVLCPLQPTTFWIAPIVFRALTEQSAPSRESYALPNWQGCS